MSFPEVGAAIVPEEAMVHGALGQTLERKELETLANYVYGALGTQGEVRGAKEVPPAAPPEPTANP